MRIAIVGVTGLVGGVMRQVLAERDFPCDEFIPVASGRSAGKEIDFRGTAYKVTGIQEAVDLAPDIALFSAGGATSLEWAPKFAKAGTTVIDNSSTWRMKDGYPLVIPEINGDVLTTENRIIANPNCSTVQLVAALAPLHKRYGIKRIVVSTYQSVSGSGAKAVKQMENERKGIEGEMAYPHPIDKNCIPHGGDFTDSGYTTEEVKLVNETRKILRAPEIAVSATVVRIPVTVGHSMAVNTEFHEDYDLDAVRNLLEQTQGLVVQDDPTNNQYPMPLYAEGKDEVFVGRLRRDEFMPNTLDMWVVSDNLRKGAATNTVQIAEYLVSNQLIQIRTDA